MSTLSGKPANPIDLSAYALQKAGERAERNSADNDRSPYAPKEAWRRADVQPPAPVRAPDGLRERSGREANESLIDRDDASEPGWPRANAQGGRDRSSRVAFEEEEEDVPQHPADLDALQSAEAADDDWYEEPPLAPRDNMVGDNDLERLESSLRWLQRQEAVTRLPPAPGLPAGPGRRHGGDKFAGDFRSPLSLEPERMAPPPLSSGRGNLRWAVYMLIAAEVAAPFAYYFSADGGGSRQEPAARPQLASSDASQAQPSVSAIRQDLAPTVARDEEPEMTREPSPQSTRAAKTGKLPARSPEGDNVAMLQPPASSPSQFPAASPSQPAVASPQPSPFPNPQPPALSIPPRTVDHAHIELLTKQGEQFVAAGDIVTARMVFQRAAEAGDAYAAMAMGATYDPGVLAKLGVVGMGADVEKARSWYQKAESMGSAEATKRLRVLAHR